MGAYMYYCVYIKILANMYDHVYVRSVCACMHIGICVHLFVNVSAYIYMCVCVFVHACMYSAYIYVCICMCKYVCVKAYLHE